MHILRGIGRRAIPVGTVMAVTATAVISTAVPAFAATAATLSTYTGPSGGGNTIVMTATGAFVGAPVIEFQAVTAGSTCAANFVAPDASNIQVIVA